MDLSLLTADALFAALVKINQTDEIPTSIKICTKLNMRRLQNDVHSYREMRDELVKKYGESDENGGMRITSQSKQWGNFQKEYEPLNNQTITCDLIKFSCTYTELLEILLKCNNIDNLNLSSPEIEILELICKEVML